MTKSKGAKLIQELINKYGDVDVALMYDYWASRLIGPDGRYMEDKIVGAIKLSQIGPITSWDDYHRLEDIACGKRPAPKTPVVVPESKEKYDSKEQEEARKKHRKDWGAMLGAGLLGHAYHNAASMYADISKISDPSPTPKQFGMAMDNHKKRH